MTQNLKLYYQGTLKLNITQDLNDEQIKTIRAKLLKKLRKRHTKRIIAESDIKIILKEVK